jgi:hypothetical protein
MCVAVENARHSFRQRCAVLERIESLSGGLDTNHLHAAVSQKRVEEPDRVRSAADRCNQQVG